MNTSRLAVTVALVSLGAVACRSTGEIRPEAPRELQKAAPPSPAAPAKPAPTVAEATPYNVTLERLLTSRSLKCEFTTSATAFWETGTPRVSPDFSGRLSTHFDAIDWKDGKARMIGSNGAVDVAAFGTPGGITFFERTDAGNFMTTTVFPWKGTDGDFSAVTSRHVGLVGLNKPPIVSQFYGSCRVFQ